MPTLQGQHAAEAGDVLTAILEGLRAVAANTEEAPPRGEATAPAAGQPTQAEPTTTLAKSMDRGRLPADVLRRSTIMV